MEGKTTSEKTISFSYHICSSTTGHSKRLCLFNHARKSVCYRGGQQPPHKILPKNLRSQYILIIIFRWCRGNDIICLIFLQVYALKFQNKIMSVNSSLFNNILKNSIKCCHICFSYARRILTLNPRNGETKYYNYLAILNFSLPQFLLY
jgi:hypothetical protein